MQPADPSPKEISYALTSELPKIYQQNPMQEVSAEESVPVKQPQREAFILVIYCVYSSSTRAAAAPVALWYGARDKLVLASSNWI